MLSCYQGMKVAPAILGDAQPLEGAELFPMPPHRGLMPRRDPLPHRQRAHENSAADFQCGEQCRLNRRSEVNKIGSITKRDGGFSGTIIYKQEHDL